MDAARPIKHSGLALCIVRGLARQMGALLFLVLHPFAVIASRGAIPRLPSIPETLHSMRKPHSALGSIKPAGKIA